MSDINIVRFEKCKKYILDSIKNSNYPKGHPFLADTFDNDYVCIVLSLIKYYIVEDCMIDDFIKKLRAIEDGRFDLERYHQALSEMTFFYYLFSGTMINGISQKILGIIYEPNSPYNPDKKLEYSFCFSDDVIVNIEIKTITCDPFIKENDFNCIEKKVILKKFFHDVDLKDYFSEDELMSFKVLEASTHYRQVSKNIKKIKEKFEGECNHPAKMINLGVIVVQFATSIEEFYTYMFHPTKGLINSLDFGNLDCLVFFSLTAKADLDMQDIYDNHHVFSVVFREEDYIYEYLDNLRLDHIAANLNKEIYSPYKEEAEKEFGRFRLINEEGFLFFVNVEKSDEEIGQYIQYLNGQATYPN